MEKERCKEERRRGGREGHVPDASKDRIDDHDCRPPPRESKEGKGK